MRRLLGTLRDIEDAGSRGGGASDRRRAKATSRAWSPTSHGRARGEPTTSSSRRTARRAGCPRGIGLTLYRVQEALANISRHSTATSAVVVRVVETHRRAYAEVEIVDNGRPRAGHSGAGSASSACASAPPPTTGGRDRSATHGWLPCAGAGSAGGRV